MRSANEIQQEIKELEKEQVELDFGSVGYDFINADLIGLYGELSRVMKESNDIEEKV